ncbi:MAG: methanogenesis marker 9 domain-containing protein [Methanomicrobiaceae archaeon]|nr:methanogenesis marker 9 domain-containing protein [Methanomicrobiaceae archaeon]
MMDPYDRFELILNDEVVKTPIAIASMAGWVDAAYVLERAAHVGAAFMGGYSIDEATLEASEALVKAGRKEFVYDDPAEELQKQTAFLKESDVVCGVNLRGSAPESFQRIAEALGRGVIYEIDAHCRQQPLIDAGCGEYLLHHPDRLAATIGALKSAGVTVSVKIRAGVAGDDRELARQIWRAGADIIHADLMDFGYAKARQLRNSCPLTLIANNSINSFGVAKEMFSHGADLVSLARQSDAKTLAALDAGVTEFADEVGWYNAPKQLCRGGDMRALTFCCMPVKECPLLPLLQRIGMERGAFIGLKQKCVETTPLEEGEHTCFGSLAFCCKSSTPCMFRDMHLRELGLSHQDYMRYKRRMAEKIMTSIFA